MSDAEQRQMDRQHIFVVNGSADFLDVLRELFQEEDYNVTTTNFVPHTFDQIAALNPSLLVIDLAVGLRAGWELLEHLGREASTRDIPVIIVSTNPDLLERARATFGRNEHTDYLRKPLDLDDLLAMVQALIGSA